LKNEKTNHTIRTIVRNVFYASLTWILPLGLNIIATPVIVGGLGNHEYGIYALMMGFVSYSFTFSFGRAITKYTAEYGVSEDAEKMRDVVSASLYFCLAVGFAGSLAMVLLARWLIGSVFLIEPEFQDKAVLAVYLTAGIILLSMLSLVFSAVLQGIHRFDVYSKIFTANSFAFIIGNVILVYCGFGLLALLSWNLLLLVVFCVVYVVATRRLYPHFGFNFVVAPGIFRMVLRYSSAIVGYQLLGNILLLFERGWITQRLGPENLTYYVVPMSLGIVLHGIVSSLVLVLFPLASELNSDREKLLQIYLKATKIISMIVVFIVVSLAVQSKTFLGLWMGPAFAEYSSTLLMIHIVCFGFISIMSISWQLSEGLGKPWLNAAANAISTVIGISLMVLLIEPMGLVGIAIARLTAFATIFFSIFIVESRFFKRVQTGFWSSMLGNLAVATTAAAVIEYLISHTLAVHWASLSLSLLAGGIAYCFVLWLLDFVTPDEKILLRHALSR